MACAGIGSDPTFETDNQMSFLGFVPNPGAGNRPGSVVYAGNNWGAASANVRYPETNFNGVSGPASARLTAWTTRPFCASAMAVFYTQAFYPGWGGGMSLDGFNPSTSFGGSFSGYVPSFNLDAGFPATPPLRTSA